MVVLSIGMKPPKDVEESGQRTWGLNLTNTNSAKPKLSRRWILRNQGIFVCGAFSAPKDIPESVAQASGAAAKAMGMIADARGTQVIAKQYPPERDVSKEEPRIGVFVCHCGINIGGVVNVPAVVEYAKTLPHVVYAEANVYTCSQDTQKLIREKISKTSLTELSLRLALRELMNPCSGKQCRKLG